MGRIYKRFTVENTRTNGKASAEAMIDSGADITLVRRDLGEQIGVDIDTDQPIAISGIGGRVLGFEVPAKITVGRTSAPLRVAVPIGRYDARTRKITAVDQKENLIGHDFLQATRSKIDFSRPIEDAFVGGAKHVGHVERVKITAAEARALREWAAQQPKAHRHHATTKKTRAQLDREIAETVVKRRTRKASH